MGKQQKLKQKRAAERAAQQGQTGTVLQSGSASTLKPEPHAAPATKTNEDETMPFTAALRVTEDCVYNPRRHIPAEPYLGDAPKLRDEDVQLIEFDPTTTMWCLEIGPLNLDVSEPNASVDFRSSEQVFKTGLQGNGARQNQQSMLEMASQMDIELYNLRELPEEDELPLFQSRTVLPPAPLPASVVAARDLAEYLSVDPPTLPSSVTNTDLQTLLTLESDIDVLTAIGNGDVNTAHDAVVSRRASHAALAVSIQASLAINQVNPADLARRVTEALTAQDSLRVEALVRRYDRTVWDLSEQISTTRRTADQTRTALLNALGKWRAAVDGEMLRQLHVRLMTGEYMLRASPSHKLVEELAGSLETAGACIATAAQTVETVGTHESALFDLNQVAQDLNRQVSAAHTNLGQLPASCEQFGFPFPDTLREQHKAALERAARLMRNPISILAGMTSDRTPPQLLEDIKAAMERRQTLVADMRSLLAHPPKSDDEIRRLVFLFYAAIVEGARRGSGLRVAGMTLVQAKLMTESERERIKTVMENQRKFFTIRDLKGTRKKAREMWCPLPETVCIGNGVLREYADPPEPLIKAIRDAMQTVKEADNERARERASARKKAAGAEDQLDDDPEEDDS